MLHKVFQTLVFFCLLISAIKGIDTRRVAKPTFRAEEDEDYDDEDSDDTKGGVFLGSFDSYAHQLSGEVTLLDDKTMEISNLNYDGTGPAAWFMLGKTSRSTLPEFIDLDGTIIPDENEACETLSRYNDDDVILKLPGKMKFSDFNYISMYCVRFNHNFGYIMIPEDIKLKNGTVSKGLKECDDDDIEDAGDSRPQARPRPRPRPRPLPPTRGSGSLLGSLLNTVFG